MSIKYIYVAGPLTPRGKYSTNGAIDYLYNLNEMSRVQSMLIRKGYVPFPTGMDFVYFLVGGPDNRITEAQIKRVSKEWLDKCDCVLLIDGWRKSPGTVAEVKRAKALNMPVFTSIQEMEEHNERNGA